MLLRSTQYSPTRCVSIRLTRDGPSPTANECGNLFAEYRYVERAGVRDKDASVNLIDSTRLDSADQRGQRIGIRFVKEPACNALGYRLKRAATPEGNDWPARRLRLQRCKPKILFARNDQSAAPR